MYTFATIIVSALIVLLATTLFRCLLAVTEYCKFRIKSEQAFWDDMNEDRARQKIARSSMYGKGTIL